MFFEILGVEITKYQKSEIAIGHGTTGSSMVNDVIWPENDFSKFWGLNIIRWHSKTIVTCATRRKEHAGRWNFALSPLEAKLSTITGFRHFSALNLTSEVTGWPRNLNLYINLFVWRRPTRSFFFCETLAQTGTKQQGGGSYPPCAVEGCEMACEG